jgi:hypothetical protein
MAQALRSISFRAAIGEIMTIFTALIAWVIVLHGIDYPLRRIFHRREKINRNE